MKMMRVFKLYTILFFIAVLFCGCSGAQQKSTIALPTTEPTAAAPALPAEVESPDVSPPSRTLTEAQADTSEPATLVQFDETLQVIVFDVGQADCALVKSGEHAMLIDAGDAGQDSLILGYLTDNGVTGLDYLVATHPHADHIGSMAAVIRNMESIGTLIMPDAVHTTQTFENMLDAIEEKEVSVSIPQPGDMFEMGNVRIQVLAPNYDGYDDLNNYSIVLRIEYGQTVFLFTGDAEDISENEQLANSLCLSADVLKVGHHGSNSSTIERYLDAIAPSYAVISCGKDNSYGHPDSETVSRLTERGITLYRTDESGTVTFTSDGNTISASTKRIEDTDNIIEATPENTQENSVSYIGNKNSKKFHLPTCGTLPAEKNRVYFTTRDEAIKNQFQACKNCNP